MASIMAFAGSNSSTSLNFKLVKYTAASIKERPVQLLNMAKLPFPMYSKDYESENGYSNSLVEFRGYIGDALGIIISVNEHNRNPSAYFKNLLDWLSRLDPNFMQDKKVLLMSTSPGRGGGAGALAVIKNLLPRFGAEVAATFSLPSFNHNFDKKKGITDPDLAQEHTTALNLFMSKIE